MTSKVYQICFAYEQGFGSGWKRNGVSNPYLRTSSEEHEAWGLGYSEGEDRANRADSGSENNLGTELDELLALHPKPTRFSAPVLDGFLRLRADQIRGALTLQAKLDRGFVLAPVNPSIEMIKAGQVYWGTREKWDAMIAVAVKENSDD